jgi:hypothetical protein
LVLGAGLCVSIAGGVLVAGGVVGAAGVTVCAIATPIMPAVATVAVAVSQNLFAFILCSLKLEKSAVAELQR